ncbi:uncharacterized protein LOC144480550 [Mustelus asterias]
MKANCILMQQWSSQDNVWYSRPMFQPASLSFMLPQLSASQSKRIHNVSKASGTRPYLKFPQFKGRVFGRMGEAPRLMSCSQKPTADSDTMAVGLLKELALRWFTETQAALILQNGRLPDWFHGFVTRKEAENLLKNRGMGQFLIRLSDRAIGYILSYRGTDRCRHFVIQQLKNGRYMIDGSVHTHKSLATLISYYMTEVIQPFGEVLTESCSQSDRNNLYDQISFNLPHSSCSEEADAKESAARMPTAAPYSEEGSRKPPAVPPKINRILNSRQLNSSLESISSNSEDSDNVPPLPVRPGQGFEEENREEVKYGRVNKLKSSEKSLAAALGEECGIKDNLANPLYSVATEGKKAQPLSWLFHPLTEPNSVIYSMAVDPQAVHNKVFEPANQSPDVVYTEVDMKQWKASTVPAGNGNSYAKIFVAPEQPSPPSEGKHLRLATPPSTTPRISPNLNHRKKPPSPTHSSQKREVNQKLVPTLRPLPHPADFNERAPAKDSAYEATLGAKSFARCPENTYEQIPEEFSKRNLAKPVTAEKDETRKKWFSKCK